MDAAQLFALGVSLGLLLVGVGVWAYRQVTNPAGTLAGMGYCTACLGSGRNYVAISPEPFCALCKGTGSSKPSRGARASLDQLQ